MRAQPVVMIGLIPPLTDPTHRASRTPPTRLLFPSRDASQTMIEQRQSPRITLLTAGLLRLEHVGADEWHQSGRDAHTAVRLLMVFQNGDQPAGGGQRAVECRRGLRFAGRI